MTREQLIDIAVDTWSNTEMDLLMNILETPTEEQQKCEYCHGDGSRFDNGNLWGGKLIQGINDFDAIVINLSKFQLVGTNALHAFPINYCPMCGRKLSD